MSNDGDHRPMQAGDEPAGNGQVHHLPPTVKQLGDPRMNASWTLLPTAPGVCSQCAHDHHPDEPHDAQSLHYQYAFYAEHGRWPTWHDAMAHCRPDVQEAWRTALRERGVHVAPPQGQR